MESIQQIKNRIESIAGTKQITRSMRLVSTVRLRRAKDRMLANAAFHEGMIRMVSEAAADPDVFNHRYLRQHAADAAYKCVIAVGGDRGLCGGYNVNVCKEARSLIRGLGKVRLITVGQKAHDYFARQNPGAQQMERAFTGISENPFLEDAEDIANAALKLYADGEADSIYLVYTKFVNMLSLIPTHIKLLPLDAAAMAGAASAASAAMAGAAGAAGAAAAVVTTAAPDGTTVAAGDASAASTPSAASAANEPAPANTRRIKPLIRYEPGCAEMLDKSVPFYIAALIFGAMLESSVCEQSSRITSMDSAVRNSEEMIESLTLQYNRARQGDITGDLADIIGGTKALKIALERPE